MEFFQNLAKIYFSSLEVKGKLYFNPMIAFYFLIITRYWLANLVAAVDFTVLNLPNGNKMGYPQFFIGIFHGAHIIFVSDGNKISIGQQVTYFHPKTVVGSTDFVKKAYQFIIMDYGKSNGAIPN